MLLLLSFVPSAWAQVNQEKTVTVTNANGKEEQIDLPTSMTEELDSTTQIYKAKNYLTRDPNCNMPDVNRTYSADVYKQRLSKLPTIIETTISCRNSLTATQVSCVIPWAICWERKTSIFPFLKKLWRLTICRLS